MTSPLVSICIPTYNAEATIAQTLDSLLKQTYQNLEIQVFDNASTDTTLDIVRQKMDERVTIHTSDRNIGGEANFQRCFEGARGRYTAIFHADDVYQAEIVARQVAFLERRPELGAVFTAANWIDESGAYMGPYKLPPFFTSATSDLVLDFKACFRNILRYGNFLICPSAMVRTEIYQQEIRVWDGERFYSSADLDVWLRIVSNHNIGLLPERLMSYRRSTAQFSYQYNRHRMEEAHMLLVIDHFMRLPAVEAWLTAEDHANFRKLVRKDLVVRACNALLSGQQERARQLLSKVNATEALAVAFASNREVKTFLSLMVVAAGTVFGTSLTGPLLAQISRRAV